ncbi:MAG: YesL family protein [Clostridiales bacterium]|nr:YesL family protein [Clostridiales bacterium]
MNESTFNSNNPAMRFLTNLFNIFWVNLLFFFTCIPIITIGPSLCALYRVCLKIISGEDPMVYNEYFREFKNSFKKGTLLWIVVLLLGGLFAFELYGIYFRDDLISGSLDWLQYPVWAMLLIVVQVFLYGFALLAVFENSFKNTIINSILLSIKHIPITILLIAVWLFTPLLVNTFPQTFYGVVGCEIFFNLALRVYICSVFLHKAFDLKKIKVTKGGVVYEQSYDDLIEYVDENDKDSSEDSSDEDDDEDDEEYEPDELDDVDEDEDEDDDSDEDEEDDEEDESDDDDESEDDEESDDEEEDEDEESSSDDSEED